MTRYEVKLVGAETDLGRALAELRLLPCALRPLHPPRVVQSIYFDTHEELALQDNLAGISKRRKLRWRWYGEGCSEVRGQLEWKRRDNTLGDKDTLPIARPITVAGTSRHAFWQSLRQQVPPPWQQRLDGREVAQWIRYRRDYLASADGLLRVTIDREFAAFDLRFELLLSCRHPTPVPRLLIVEIKADAGQRDAIEDWLQDVRLPPGKCSKFVVASRPGEAPVASRFG